MGGREKERERVSHGAYWKKSEVSKRPINVQFSSAKKIRPNFFLRQCRVRGKRTLPPRAFNILLSGHLS